MKLALVILHADPTRGGAERYTHDLAAALAGRGNDVSLLASTFGVVPDGVKPIQLSADGWSRTARYLHFLKSLRKHLDATRYDIVHAMLPVPSCDLYHPHAGLADPAVRHARGMRRVVNVFNPRRSAFARIERELIAAGNATVLCLSERMKRQVLSEITIAPECVAVLFNGVNLNRFQVTEPPPSDALRLLIVAQDFARKGLKQAIEATARVPGAMLTVVGRDDPAPYRRVAESLHVSDHVKFIGPVGDVRPYYAQADAFVLPTSHDPCSLVVLEALASGLPAISTTANGACEIMTDGVHGFVMNDPADVAGLTDHLMRMRDTAARAKMRQACIELRPALSFDAHVERLMAIVENRSR